MARRRNSDALFRSLVRRVAAGEINMIPALAREWERAGGAPLPALDEVARTFENLERNGDHHDAPVDILELFRNMEDYPECDEDAAINRDVGYLEGVADALGMTIEALWEESERVRSGAGAMRRDLARHSCHQCDLQFRVGEDGVANHLDDDGEIDHDADEDHVPYAAEDEDKDATQVVFCDACDELPDHRASEHTPDCSQAGSVMCALHHECDEGATELEETDGDEDA